MKKLQIKRQDFSSGKKIFFFEDNSFTVLSEAPEEFSFGVEIPNEEGIFTFSSGQSSYVLKTGANRHFYVFVNREEFSLSTTGVSFTKVTYENEVTIEEEVYFPDRVVYYTLFLENFVVCRERNVHDTVFVINLKEKVGREYSFPISVVNGSRLFYGAEEEDNTVYLYSRDRKTSVPVDHKLHVSLIDWEADTFTPTEITFPGIPTTASSIAVDGGIKITEDFIYLYDPRGTPRGLIIKLDKQLNYLYHQEGLPETYLEPDDVFLNCYNMEVGGEYIYLPGHSYRGDVCELYLAVLQDTGTEFLPNPGLIRLEEFVEEANDSLGFTEIYYSQIEGDNIYLVGWRWDNYFNAGAQYENGIYLASVSLNTLEKNWSRIYYESEVDFPFEEGGTYKLIVINDRIYVAIDTFSSTNEEKLYVFSIENGDFIERLVPGYRYVII
jgi:hypothetical protein